MAASSQQSVQVWDPFVRVFHWSLVVAFLAAYFVEPEGSNLAVHVWAGYAVGGLVVLRIIWGFIGPKHARFSDFLFGPFAALRYLFSILGGNSKRYLGHSPAGAWMVFALLTGLSATVISGMSYYGQAENKGPLGAVFAETKGATAATGPALADEENSDDDAAARPDDDEDERLEELHEVFANLTLVLALLHIGGVILASFAHHENLARAMITGRKRPE